MDNQVLLWWLVNELMNRSDGFMTNDATHYSVRAVSDPTPEDSDVVLTLEDPNGVEVVFKITIEEICI